jgi:hypothetical protein
MGYREDISTQMLSFPCSICGTVLRDPVSLERGWGPICDRKYMGGAGGALVAAKMIQAFDPEEAAAAIREAPNAKPRPWHEPVQGGVKKVYKKGETLPDGSVAEGYVVEAETKTLQMPGLRDYWEKKGGKADNKRAKWRTDPEVRRTMVSNGIWYASRAMYYGYRQDIVSADKVDPRWTVVASVQRFARAVGLGGAAERMTNFYGVKVRRVIQASMKEAVRALGGKKGAGSVSTIVFEEVPPGHPIEVWNPQLRRKERTRTESGVYRIHAPYSEEFNRVARANEAIFFAREKDKPYFWRYFHQRDLREVINIVQGTFDDKPAVTRKMMTPQQRREIARRLDSEVLILDAETQEVRWFSRAQATRLTAHPRYQEVKL